MCLCTAQRLVLAPLGASELPSRKEFPPVSAPAALSSKVQHHGERAPAGEAQSPPPFRGLQQAKAVRNGNKQQTRAFAACKLTCSMTVHVTHPRQSQTAPGQLGLCGISTLAVTAASSAYSSSPGLSCNRGISLQPGTGQLKAPGLLSSPKILISVSNYR